MASERDVEFLAEKLELLCGIMDHDGTRASARSFFGTILESIRSGRASARSRTGLEKLERTMEQMLGPSLDATRRPEVDSLLVRTHGRASLCEKPADGIARILRQGRIATDSDADLVRNFLSDLGNEDLVGRDGFNRLATMMVAYGD